MAKSGYSDSTTNTSHNSNWKQQLLHYEQELLESQKFHDFLLQDDEIPFNQPLIVWQRWTVALMYQQERQARALEEIKKITLIIKNIEIHPDSSPETV